MLHNVVIFNMQIRNVAELIRHLAHVMCYVVGRNTRELFKRMIDYCQYIDIRHQE